MAIPTSNQPTTGPSDEKIRQAVRQGSYYAPKDGPVNPVASQETNRINQERMKAQEILDKNKGIKGTLTGTKPSVVLARKNGIEGKLDKTTGAFNAGNWDKTQSSRFVKQGTANYNTLRTAGKPQEAQKTGLEVWRTANPKLAAAADEKARIRGTAQSDNPLMKGFTPRMAGPTVQSPAVQKLGQGYQSLTQNSRAGISPTPTPAATAAAPVRPVAPVTPVAAPVRPVAPVTPVAAPVRPVAPVARPMMRTRSQVLNQSMEYDAFNIILEYLTSEGHVDSIDEALYVMMEMDSDCICDIIQSQR
jgi:hypothetical protein